jgi:hypothetical protein
VEGTARRKIVVAVRPVVEIGLRPRDEAPPFEHFVLGLALADRLPNREPIREHAASEQQQTASPKFRCESACR